MRWGLVGLVVALAGCESRYGAYLAIQGDIEVDEVELYFGDPIDSSGTGNGGAFATPTFGAQLGVIFDRTFDPSDVVKLAAVTKQTTYYVAPNETNQHLGAYVVAVGLRDGHPVGIAEYFNFAVPTDEVYEYFLTLEPWNPLDAERWGAEPGCVAWKRPRSNLGGLVAVVHADDRDCDVMPRDVDCNDLCNADAAGCAADQTFCNTTGLCALGCSRNGLCAATMCLPSTACSTICATKPTLAERLACGASTTSSHVEINVERNDGKLMCATSFVFKPGVPCTMPAIVARDPAIPAGFAYSIASDPDDPRNCLLSVTQAATAPLDDFADHHLLISYASPTLGPRITTVVGVAPKPNQLVCATSPFYSVTAPLPDDIYDCL